MGAQRFQIAFLIYFTKLNIYSTKYSMKNNNLKFCAFAAVLIIAVAGIAFTSCNKDEKESRMEDISKAVGTWSCIRSTETYQGVNQEDLVVDGKVCINIDGTYTSTIEAIGYKGTYSYDGKRIEVTKSSGESFIIEISINNRRMTWRGIYKNGTSFYYIFNKTSLCVSEGDIPLYDPAKWACRDEYYKWLYYTYGITTHKINSDGNGSVVGKV